MMFYLEIATISQMQCVNVFLENQSQDLSIEWLH